MEVQKLLDRIRFVKPISKLNASLLEDLCVSYISAIPFDCLDLHGGVRRKFGLEEFYDNIVRKNRGGFCCEMNGLLHWMLSEIGFSVKLLMGHPFHPVKDEFFENGSHSALLVNLDSEGQYLVDAGWGGTSFLFPLKLIEQEEQHQQSGAFRIRSKDGFLVVEKKRQKQINSQGQEIITSGGTKQAASKHVVDPDWNILYRFTTGSRELADFEEEFNNAMREQPFITNNSAVILQTEKGRKFLIGKTFVVKEYVNPLTVQTMSVKECSDDEMMQILKSEFGITLDFELHPITDRHWKNI